MRQHNQALLHNATVNHFLIVLLNFTGVMSLLKRCTCTLIIVLSGFRGFSQTNWPSPEVEQMYLEARGFLTRGNFQQAIMVYSRAVRIAPDIMILQKDLANAYYLSGYNEEAEKTLEPVIKSGQADEECYQIMAAALLADKEDRKAKNVLQKGMERYPHSGILFNQAGKMYEELQKEEDALKTWLQGIEADPAYHLNYYDAARTYMRTSKTVWAIIYAEIFVNLEQATPRSNETRQMLITAYRRLFNSFAIGEIPKFNSRDKADTPDGFEGAVYNTFLKLSPIVTDGFGMENLVMLRSRFMMDWTMSYTKTYPFTLFNRHDEMIRNGYFDTYNQWLFGRAISSTEYEAWNKFHPKEMPEFENWLKEHPYKPVGTDFYNNGVVTNIFDKKKD